MSTQAAEAELIRLRLQLAHEQQRTIALQRELEITIEEERRKTAEVQAAAQERIAAAQGRERTALEEERRKTVDAQASAQERIAAAQASNKAAQAQAFSQRKFVFAHSRFLPGQRGYHRVEAEAHEKVH